MKSLFGGVFSEQAFSIICLTFGVGVHYNKRGTSPDLWRLLSPERGCVSMTEFDAIVLLVVATGYLLAITQKK